MGRTVLKRIGKKWINTPPKLQALQEQLATIPPIGKFAPYANAYYEQMHGIEEGIRAIRKEFGGSWTPVDIALLEYIETYGLPLKSICDDVKQFDNNIDCENETFTFLKRNQNSIAQKSDPEELLFMKEYKEEIIASDDVINTRKMLAKILPKLQQHYKSNRD